MSNDRELLELAAKAAGYVTWDGDDEASMCCPSPSGSKKWWRPLTDDGDALRLAVKLRIDVTYYSQHVEAWTAGIVGEVAEVFCRDPATATRRAIVRAAAEIGRSMP